MVEDIGKQTRKKTKLEFIYVEIQKHIKVGSKKSRNIEM